MQISEYGCHSALSFVPFKLHQNNVSALSCESMAQPLADKIFLTSQRSLFSHSARQDVFLSLTFTNLKQNYSVIAHGYKDKARSRRRESYKESTAERERDTVYIPFSKIVLLINRAGYRDWQNAFDRSNSWTEDGLKSMVFIRSLWGVSIFSPCLPPSLFHPL